jgi:DNA-binding response OmpR family regulator/DNA-binding CsgD family transcriptional regulator
LPPEGALGGYGRPGAAEAETYPAALDARGDGVVLIVDDLPENLAVLHDALDESGYTVLVAVDGPSALQRASEAQPDIILLDALMPGMDGFEVARRLKADPGTSAIPIVFLTALNDTDHVLAAFSAGGTDYCTKPIRPREVVARIATHLRNARQARQARNALDAFGHASLSLRASDGRILWQTPLARQMMQRHFGLRVPMQGPALAPPALCDWVRTGVQAAGGAGPAQAAPWTWVTGHQRLTCTLHPASSDEEWMVILTEASDASDIEALALRFGLTAREAEVLHWVARGKTNRDIGDILGTSPRTITKHLEHVFEKLGVETRTAAAARALGLAPAAAPVAQRMG